MQGRFGQLMLVSFSPQFSPHFWKKTFWWAWGENTQAHPFFSTPPPNQTPLKTSFSPLFSPKFSIFLKISPNKHTLSLIPSLQIPIFQHPKSPPHHIFKKGCGNEHHKVPVNNNFFLLFSDNFFFVFFVVLCHFFYSFYKYFYVFFFHLSHFFITQDPHQGNLNKHRTVLVNISPSKICLYLVLYLSSILLNLFKSLMTNKPSLI